MGPYNSYKGKEEGVGISKIDIAIIWIVLFLLIYPFITRALADVDLDPEFNETGEIAPGMREQVGIASEVNVVLRRSTFFGYRTVREGESMYLYGIYVLPDEVLGYSFRDLWIHHIIIYTSILCLIALLVKRFMTLGKEVNITWK